MNDKKEASGISRRHFIKGVGGGIIGTATVSVAADKKAINQTGLHGAEIRGPDEVTISLRINGKPYTLKVEPHTTLLDVIRNHLGLTGTKRVCNRGECGACTVILNGKLVYACSLFALDADKGEIQTIEGLATGEELHPIQKVFIKHDALQCGFCTSGFIMSSKALLDENYSPSMEEIKEGLAGNVCRCGTYTNIFEAVNEAANDMRKGG